MKNVMALVNVNSSVHPAFDLVQNLVANEGSSIDVVCSIPTVPNLLHALWSSESKEYERELFAETQSALSTIVQRVRKPEVALGTYVVQGVPFVEIIHLAHRNGSELLVTDETMDLASEPGTAPDNTNFRLLRKCPCPLWFVRSAEPVAPKNVVAAIDVQDSGEESIRLNVKILQYARDLALRFSAELHVVQAWELVGAGFIESQHGSDEYNRARDVYLARVKAEVESVLERVIGRSASARLHLLNGAPEVVIDSVIESERTDLLVMGTVARSGVSGFIMGNTAEKVLHTVKCSILALKPDGFRSPVL